METQTKMVQASTFSQESDTQKAQGPLPYPSSQGSAGKAMAEGCKPRIGLPWGHRMQSSHQPSLVTPPGTRLLSACFSSELKTSPSVCLPSRVVN